MRFFPREKGKTAFSKKNPRQRPLPLSRVGKNPISQGVENRGSLISAPLALGVTDSFQKGLEVCYCLWGVPSRPSPGSYPGPVQVPSRVRGGPVQIRHVLCFTVFRTHPGPEVGAIPARPGPILLPSVPHRIGPGRAETDFLATSEVCNIWMASACASNSENDP